MDPRLTEEQGDLFEYEGSHSLAHCVSVDLHMGKGIAVEFKKRYRGLEELKSQGPHIGGVLVLPTRTGNYAFYLVTKARYYQKPTYEALRSAVNELKEACERLHVSRLAVPRLGCGLDGLQWSRVRELLLEVFAPTSIQIVVRAL